MIIGRKIEIRNKKYKYIARGYIVVYASNISTKKSYVMIDREIEKYDPTEYIIQFLIQ